MTPTPTSASSRSTCAAPSSTPPSTTSTSSPSGASSSARPPPRGRPPTADQPGLIGPNWAKGWVIEDNVIHDAKCVAISIGKEASTGDNNYTRRGDKPGYQYQLESVFSAQQIGWDKEHIGSHVIRRNTIYDCGQCAIAGHLGCVFSTIEDNHIHRIALKREFYGHEIAGIKLHAAIDVEITHNRIHACSLGIWLDWQTQGTRVARNVLYGNSRDLFVEVSHGPYVIDHNVLASRSPSSPSARAAPTSATSCAGTLGLIRVMDRATPYHRPHSTQVAGYAVIYGADDRWIGNVFAGGEIDAAYGTRRAHVRRRGGRHRRLRRPPVRPSRTTSPSSTRSHRATTTASPTCRSPSTSVTTRMPGRHARMPPRTLRCASTPRPSPSSRRVTRSTSRPSCPSRSTGCRSGSSPAPTWPGPFRRRGLRGA